MKIGIVTYVKCDNYGAELQFYIGKDTDFVLADAERTIREALLQDDRILDIEDFSAKQIDLNSVSVSFTVVSVAGSFNYKKEVKVLWAKVMTRVLPII